MLTSADLVLTAGAVWCCLALTVLRVLPSGLTLAGWCLFYCHGPHYTQRPHFRVSLTLLILSDNSPTMRGLKLKDEEEDYPLLGSELGSDRAALGVFALHDSTRSRSNSRGVESSASRSPPTELFGEVLNEDRDSMTGHRSRVRRSSSGNDSPAAIFSDFLDDDLEDSQTSSEATPLSAASSTELQLSTSSSVSATLLFIFVS